VHWFLISTSEAHFYFNIAAVVRKFDSILEQIKGQLDDAALVTTDPAHAIIEAFILDRHLDVFVLCLEGNDTDDFVKWLVHLECAVLAFECLHPKCRQIHRVPD
jgi:hypothetical protein